MKRRSFLAMLGLAPVAAVAAPRLPLHVEASYTGPLTATDFQWFDEPREYACLAKRGDVVSYERFIDFDGIVPRPGESRDEDSTAFSSVAVCVTDGEGVERTVWIR